MGDRETMNCEDSITGKSPNITLSKAYLVSTAQEQNNDLTEINLVLNHSTNKELKSFTKDFVRLTSPQISLYFNFENRAPQEIIQKTYQ